MKRRDFLYGLSSLAAASLTASRPSMAVTVPADDAALARIADGANELGALRSLLIANGGRTVLERGYRRHSVNSPTNIKSASKSVVSVLVGIAIDKGLIEGVDQRVAPLLKADLPRDVDPRMQDVTIGNLLSMQAGLGRTSGANYGRWISSRNWVRAALAEPFADEPGGRMLYSTGSTHLLSAILTKQAGASTLDLARRWLAPIEDFNIASWQQDPQGVYLGGNQMSMSPRSLLAFGELCRNRGRTSSGVQVVSHDWIDQSWIPRTRSQFNGDGYGYGWFLRQIGGEEIRYAWGYGGQMLYIVPSRHLSVVMTSDEDNPSARSGYRDQLHRLLEDILVATQT